MSRRQGISLMRSVRAKLLMMLILLSLPLLIISLIQLRSYSQSLSEQEKVVARTELAATAPVLSAWLKEHETESGRQVSVQPNELGQLYERLRSQLSPTSETSLAVFNEQGTKVIDSDERPAPPAAAIHDSPLNIAPIKWDDGITRPTTYLNVAPYNWKLAVGVSPTNTTYTNSSVLMVTMTWAFAVLASSLIAVWAVGRYTKPVRLLAASVSTFGEGNFQERIPVETSDEVGTLAEGFNIMAGQLAARFEELRTQRAFIEEIIDSLPLGLAVLDDKLMLRRANPTFARFVGGDAAALKGRGLYETASGLSILSEMIEEVRTTRKPFVTYGLPLNLSGHGSKTEGGETNGRNEDDGHYWDLTLWPIAAREAGGELLLILSEVSKRVRAEKLATSAFAAERARAAELESLINQLNEGVVIVDRQGLYRINPAAAEIIGRKRSEFRDGINALLADIALRNPAGEKLPLENTPIFRALEKGEHVSNEQLKILRLDGEIRVLSVSATPLVGEAGKHDGAVAIFRDITDEVRQHDELVASYDRLREHDRLKSAFVATVSHEFRTPLNVIIGLCQLLDRDRQPPLGPLQAEAVTRMERNARSLLELVNALLDYSRLEAGRAALHLESVNVGEVIAEIAAENMASATGKGIQLNVDVSPELGRVITDRRKFAQVVANLVNNAIKFTSVGSVTISAAPTAEDDDRWYLTVTDTGIGITNEALGFVFDEFRQADDTLARAYGGTGLGLAITRKIVELLDGIIKVESRPNEGSRFHIIWPRLAQPRTGTGSLLGANVTELVEAQMLRRKAR